MQPQEPQPGVRIGPGRTIPESLLEFSFVSSSGPGGQNVNKRATKCQLRVRLADLPLTPGQIARLTNLAGSAVTLEGDLLITADEYRSQPRNKDACIDRFAELVRRALVPPKVRRATRPSRGSVERRLQEKRVRSERKRHRGSSE